MDTQTVPLRSAVSELAAILESPQIADLIERLEATRWTGRPGYPIQSMVGIALAKSLYAIPTWTRTVALVAEHPALAAVVAPDGDVPSVYACYRFTVKLREHKDALDACIASVVRALKRRNPLLGWDVAIDASDMPAYANGQRFKSKGGEERKTFSDPDASWGHRSAVSTRKGGGFYGYRLHMACCSKTDLPLAWRVETGKANEGPAVSTLLDVLKARGIDPETATLDKGYDTTTVHDACTERGVLPVVALRQTPAVKRGEHKPPSCEHGDWRFAGADRKRGATKWRCPTGACKPASMWVKGRSPAPADPARDAAVEGALPAACVGRAGIRAPEERMGAHAAAGAQDRARTASRGPDGAGAACVGADQNRGCSNRGVGFCPRCAVRAELPAGLPGPICHGL